MRIYVIEFFFRGPLEIPTQFARRYLPGSERHFDLSQYGEIIAVDVTYHKGQKTLVEQCFSIFPDGNKKWSWAKTQGSHEAKSVGGRLVQGSLYVTCFEKLCWSPALESWSWFWKQKSRKKLRLSFLPQMKETPLQKRWGPRAASSCNLPCCLVLKPWWLKAF